MSSLGFMIKLCHQFQVDTIQDAFRAWLLGRKTTRGDGSMFLNGAAMIDAHPTGTWSQSQQQLNSALQFPAFFC